MTDDYDELELLRRANPVPTSGVADENELATLANRVERMTMENDQTSVRVGHRPRTLALVAAGVAVVAAGVIAAIAFTGTDDANVKTAKDTTTTISSGPISPGGLSASCVEMYNLTTLTHRERALDGTVQSVNGDAITVKVNEWFHGGDGATATFNGASTLGGMTSAGAGVDLSPGSRLLLAGDGGFAWSCGYTQPYDATVADSWRAALSNS